MSKTSMPINWFPDSLYNTAVSVVVSNYAKYRKDFKVLPDGVRFDIYYKIYIKGLLCQLSFELCDLMTFASMLKITDRRHLLHHCFQALVDHGVAITKSLSDSYRQHCCVADVSEEESTKRKAIELGFHLGGFLADAGWYGDAEQVMMACLQLCKMGDSETHMRQALECTVRLFRIRNSNCKFHESEETWQSAQHYMQQLSTRGMNYNRAAVYGEQCALLFAKSLYDQAYKVMCLAVKELRNNLNPRITIDVLRTSTKVCIAKRKFRRAGLLIKHAVYVAKEAFGTTHHKYSDALLDYGYYLISIDRTKEALQVYKLSLRIRQSVFGGKNLHLGIIHEDIAYATYVHSYNSGKFEEAREHSQKALDIVSAILPENHLLISSSKRVKALILEEIALESQSKQEEESLLQEALELHTTSLKISLEMFGEYNLLSAKHYGNMGRLFQSMRLFNQAVSMHKKAIKIKEQLLGEEDYEVALSLGHLASLYNYDMKQYKTAEVLYLRSVKIGIKLFGSTYSGLEYDYRGLIHLYSILGDAEKAQKYTHLLHRWHTMRSECDEARTLLDHLPNNETENVVAKFFKNSVTTVECDLGDNSHDSESDSCTHSSGDDADTNNDENAS